MDGQLLPQQKRDAQEAGPVPAPELGRGVHGLRCPFSCRSCRVGTPGKGLSAMTSVPSRVSPAPQPWTP